MTRKMKRNADSTLNFVTRHKKKLLVAAVVVALIAVYVRKTWIKEISQTADDDKVSPPAKERFGEAHHSSSRSGSGSAEDISFDVGEDDSLYAPYNEADQKEIISKSEDDHDFLKLVNEHYNEADLVQWEPMPPSVSKPEEPGDLGAAVVIPDDRQQEALDRFKENEFNVVASEMMSVNRTLADSRYPECLELNYPKKLPTVSVIIVFHNEAWSTLTRTLWSVINQTPKALLKEIILVDDLSTLDFLGEKLDKFVRTLPVSITMVRQLSRKGLIQARLMGVKYSTGKVLVFLDAHCECNQGWLEPLLAPIVESRSTVTVPIIDVIDFKNMQLVTAVTNSRGIFDMSMTFSWGALPNHERLKQNKNRTILTKAPAMAGGLYAIDKEYFQAIGSYDEEMRIWGGENIEMSLRLWMCGGRILSPPCSRVGHIFRDETPYEMPGGSDKVIFGNEARFVDVWLDEYKGLFYAIVPSAGKLRTDVSKRLELREKLQCKSFRWYLDNVFPEAPFNVNYTSVISIESVFLEGQCLDTMGRRQENDPIGISNCHQSGGNQAFMITNQNEIRAKKFCLDATAPGSPATIFTCHKQEGNQYWKYDADTLALKHSVGSNCLTANEDETMTIQPCDGTPPQQWILHKLA